MTFDKNLKAMVKQLCKHCHWSLARRYISVTHIYIYIYIYIYIIWLDHVLQTSINLIKKQEADNTLQKLTDGNDLGLLINTPAQAESLLNSLELDK